MKKLLALVSLVFSFGAMAEIKTFTSDGDYWKVPQHLAYFDADGKAIGDVYMSAIDKTATWRVTGCFKKGGNVEALGRVFHWEPYNFMVVSNAVAMTICSGAIRNSNKSLENLMTARR